jgi:hypothetical protein
MNEDDPRKQSGKALPVPEIFDFPENLALPANRDRCEVSCLKIIEK